MSTTEPLRTLTVDVDGGIHAHTLPNSTALAEHLRTQIGGIAVDGAQRLHWSPLATDLVVWSDDEGLLVEEPRMNHGAAAIAAAYGITWQPFVGVAVFTGGWDDEDETLGLTAEQVTALRHVATLGYTRAIARQVTYVADLR